MSDAMEAIFRARSPIPRQRWKRRRSRSESVVHHRGDFPPPGATGTGFWSGLVGHQSGHIVVMSDEVTFAYLDHGHSLQIGTEPGGARWGDDGSLQLPVYKHSVLHLSHPFSADQLLVKPINDVVARGRARNMRQVSLDDVSRWIHPEEEVVYWYGRRRTAARVVASIAVLIILALLVNFSPPSVSEFIRTYVSVIAGVLGGMWIWIEGELVYVREYHHRVARASLPEIRDAANICIKEFSRAKNVSVERVYQSVAGPINRDLVRASNAVLALLNASPGFARLLKLEEEGKRAVMISWMNTDENRTKLLVATQQRSSNISPVPYGSVLLWVNVTLSVQNPVPDAGGEEPTMSSQT